MCGGAGSGDGSTSITPPRCVGPRLVLLRGGRRALSIPLCCQEPSSWAFHGAGLALPSPREKGWSLRPAQEHPWSPGDAQSWLESAQGLQMPFPCPFGRLVRHQALACEEQKLKEGLGVSKAALGAACPLCQCFGECWVTLLSSAGCMKEMKAPVLFSLPRAAEWPCFIIFIDFDLTTDLTMQFSPASGCS